MTVINIEFTDRSIDRWIENLMLCHQPMIDQVYSYRKQIFESKGGYWVFNGTKFSGLDDIKKAILTYSDEITRRLAMVADS